MPRCDRWDSGSGFGIRVRDSNAKTATKLGTSRPGNWRLVTGDFERSSCLRLLRQLGEPAREKAALRLLPRQGQRALVRRAGVRRSTQPTAQIRFGGVGEPVLDQVSALENRVDNRETRLGPVPHRHRDGAIQLDDR